MQCAKHALACGPDGRCVLCRRHSPGASSSASTRPIWLAVIGLFLVAGGASALGLARREAHVSSAEPVPFTPTVAATPVPDPPQEPPTASATADRATPAPLSPADEARLQGLLGVARGGIGTGAPPAEPSPAPQTVSADPPPAPTVVAATAGRDWRAAARALHVVIYTASWCRYCRQAKAWMSANGVPYEERDIEASAENARAMRRLNPRGSIPTFDVGGTTMVGFSEAAFIDLVQRASP